MLCLLGKCIDISISAFLPPRQVQFRAEREVTLDAAQDILEDIVAEVLLEQLVDLATIDLSFAELECSILNNGTHLIRQLFFHRVVNLHVRLLLSHHVLLDGCFGINLVLFLQILFHLCHAIL